MCRAPRPVSPTLFDQYSLNPEQRAREASAGRAFEQQKDSPYPYFRAGIPMNFARLVGLTTFLTVAAVGSLMSSCSNSDDIFKALKIGYVPAEEQKAEEEKAIAELEKQLAGAQEKETVLKEQLADLEKDISERDAALNEQIAELQKELSERELVIEALRRELNEQEELISIQGKVIGLLDDADQTLQKSIEEQVRRP
ncbi:MAG: hypothetical protein P8X86_01800 [Desulfofustis sp.]|jgi:septal ring factor EnvC (AmiA/AmiB activator)